MPCPCCPERTRRERPTCPPLPKPSGYRNIPHGAITDIHRGIVTRRSHLLLLLCLPASAVASGRSGGAQTYELAHGRWFDGRDFVPRTVFVDRGVIVASRPPRLDSVIDLAGRFLVSPYGEAHNHNIEGAPAETITRYLAAGIFYVKDPCSFPEAAVQAINRLNVRTSIDGVFSGGCLTSPGGHPSGLVRRNIARGSMKDGDGDGRFFYALTDSLDFERRWPAILAAKTDFIKIILVYSEEHARRRKDPAFFNWHGMDPALITLVTARAHAAGLRVSAHIESAADFHAALAGGVDEINHMPGFRPDRDSVSAFGDLHRYELSPADARLAARRRTVVVTTLGESIAMFATRDTSALPAGVSARVRALYVRNLRLLRDSRVRVVLGSDNFRGNTVREIMMIRSLAVFTDRGAPAYVVSRHTPRDLPGTAPGLPRRRMRSVISRARRRSAPRFREQPAHCMADETGRHPPLSPAYATKGWTRGGRKLA
ncbi:amidohydrolase family protein [soil metagenome]